MNALETKQKSYSDALKALMRVIDKGNYLEDEFMRDSLIQRFEFSVEACWKLYKTYLQERGLQIATPKGVFRELFKNGILTEKETELSLNMVDDRNNSSHTYKEEFAIEMAGRIIEYIPLLNKLEQNF